MNNDKYRKLNKAYWSKYDNKKKSFYMLEIADRLIKKHFITEIEKENMIKFFEIDPDLKISKNTQNFKDRYKYYMQAIAYFDVKSKLLWADKHPIEQYITKYLEKSTNETENFNTEMVRYEKVKETILLKEKGQEPSICIVCKKINFTINNNDINKKINIKCYVCNECKGLINGL